MEKSAVIYDLFISYRHSVEGDFNAVRDIATHLRQNGLEVFVDESGIEHFDSITQTINRDLANSKALLVYLTKDYFSSRACLWELTSAFITANKGWMVPRDRIFIVYLSDTTENLNQLPVELRDAKYALPLENVLKKVPERLRKIDGTFQDLGPLSSPKTYGRNLTSSPRFVGRLKEMWDLHSHLNESGYTMVTGQVGPDIVQVSGMGGIGKSLLAEEYALRFGAAYPGGVFWLDAHGSFTPDAPDIEIFKAACNEQFVTILRSHGENPAPDTPFEILKASISRIIEKGGERCLWIVDNLPCGLGDHLNIVRNWFSPHPLACTLVTTRSREYLSIGREVALDVIERSAALELLEKHGIDTKNQETAATELIELLGGNFMALDVAGTVIAGSSDTITRYLEELKEGMDELLDVPRELVGLLPSGHDRSIVRTMQHSILNLGNESLDFLRMAAHLSPAPIPIKFIESVFGRVDGLDWRESRKRARCSVLGCKQFSLAKQVAQFWQVHPLVSATVKYLGQAFDERGKHFRTEAIKVLSNIIRSNLSNEAAESISLEVEHARFLTSMIEGKEDLALLRRLADFDNFRGHRRLAVEEWQRIFEKDKELLGSDHPDTLTSINNLALTLRNMGDHSGARELQEQVLERMKEILGPDHPDTLTSMGNLASTLKAMGDNRGAREVQEQVLERMKEILGPDHPSTLTSINNLALTLRNMGDHSGARELQEQVLKGRKEILGPDHPDTLTSMNNLASTLKAMGDNRGAKELEEQVLERRKEILGPDHPDTLASMNNLAATLWNIGDYRGAREVQEQVLERMKEILGPDHPSTLTSINNLALTLRNMGDNRGARELQEQVLERMKEILGPDHPDTLSSMGNLAATLWNIGDYRGAKELQEQVLERMKELFGPNHPDTLTSMNNLAAILWNIGDNRGARELQEQVLERRKKILGPNHPDTLTSMRNLSNMLAEHLDSK